MMDHTKTLSGERGADSQKRMVRPLPCPFCGTEAMVMTWQCNDDPRLTGWRCGCLEPDCDINPFTRTRWITEREAVESWNHRPNDQALRPAGKETQ